MHSVNVKSAHPFQARALSCAPFVGEIAPLKCHCLHSLRRVKARARPQTAGTLADDAGKKFHGEIEHVVAAQSEGGCKHARRALIPPPALRDAKSDKDPRPCQLELRHVRRVASLAKRKDERHVSGEANKRYFLERNTPPEQCDLTGIPTPGSCATCILRFYCG